MTPEERFSFKFKYDKMFDDVFFTSKFRQYIVERCKYCPNGLTIDTNIKGETPTFHVCTKKYGFDFIHERVPGDFYDLKYGVGDKLADALLEYMCENHPELYDEMYSFGYEVYG